MRNVVCAFTFTLCSLCGVTDALQWDQRSALGRNESEFPPTEPYLDTISLRKQSLVWRNYSEIAPPEPSEDPHSCRKWCQREEPYGIKRSDTLPNVLIVGDSVSMSRLGYYRTLLNALDGIASVHHQGRYGDPGTYGTCGNSFGINQCLKTFIGHGDWDVISFNWGLHDICIRYYGNVTWDSYVANLAYMYKTLKSGLAPGGSIIWQETTPIPPASKDREPAEILKLNALASQVLHNIEKKPRISKLYEPIVNECRLKYNRTRYPLEEPCPEMQREDNVHFIDAGNNFTGMLVASSILRELKRMSKIVNESRLSQVDNLLLPVAEYVEETDELEDVTAFAYSNLIQ